MLRLFPLVGVLFLAGCYAGQKQQLASCELQAKREVQKNSDLPYDVEVSEYIVLCMRARGYEFDQDWCPLKVQVNSILKPTDPDYLGSLSEEQKKKHYRRIGEMIILIERMQKGEPACYEPMGWVGKQLLAFEKWIGTAN